MAVAIETSFGQQFDNSGNVLNGGSVTVYDAGTTNLRNIYSDTALSSAASNPITLDSAGRHDMRYTAATAYKIVVKNAAGTTLYTRDNIDPGVPIGSGFLAVANGGTGATEASTALTNLGGVSASTVADLESEVAALAGAASSTEKTHIATGTTAQRTASPEVGDIRHNTTTSKYEVYNGSSWDNLVLEVGNRASLDNIRDEASSDLIVTPARIKYNPGVAKAWARVEAADGSPSYVDQWGFTGAITDHGAGEYTLSFATSMANANYAVAITPRSSASARCAHVHTQASGSVRVLITASDGTATDTDFLIIVHGDL